MTFKEWFNSAPHRAKYTDDHPAYLAAKEAWDWAHEACAKVCMNLESRADIPDGGPQAWWEIGCVDCADAIRARGNHANG